MGSHLLAMRRLEHLLQDFHVSPCGLREREKEREGEGIRTSLRVRVIDTPLSERAFQADVAVEQVAFKSLAHAKSSLVGILLGDREERRHTAAALESLLALSRRGYATLRKRQRAQLMTLSVKKKKNTTTRNGDDNNNNEDEEEDGEALAAEEVPRVIFDEREFRSGLPYALHAAGLEIIPLTLITGDYILSSEYVVERKSVPDFLQSLQSGRLAKQCAAMSRQYAHPLCLIEFNPMEPAQLLRSSTASLTSTSLRLTLDSFAHKIYFRFGKLLRKFPQIRFLWSRGPLHTAAMFAEMKETIARENVDPSTPALTMSAGALDEMEEGGGGRGLSQMAMRVLSKFPGVTNQNINGVMQLCGSLTGLATIAKSSLSSVMSSEEADTLYAFLHDPIVEEIA